MALAYPPAFEQLWSNPTARPLRSGVDQLANLFDGWLSTSRVPFFTDYTDHGVDHLNQVLATANGLITDAARSVFTAADAAVLTVATLFHDSALHLSEVGFFELIRGTASKWEVKGFGDRPWPVLWDEFLFSAKRWDERKLKDVLGETSDGAPRAEVRDPFAHYDNLLDTDRKLIGEFIRRHHPRMAHEFAVHGVPGRTLISVKGILGDDLRDLAGLVARSHGQSVRSCLPYLHPAPPSKYHRREYKGVHAVYLMTLLRVADYLQIQAERANALVFKYRRIPSELSKQEWKAHNAVSNITQTHDDPESIEIQAHPEDVHTYLRLKEWLAGIQTELDASWAVLGETYGLHPDLCKFGLILRRVRSNLDDAATFAKTVEYVPQRIELAVARADLLKLLVGPLYDNVPSIGIRELMQNAIDAVRERESLQERHPELKIAPLIELSNDNDVEIRIGPPDEKGTSWLTVRDRGVGMMVETVRDYFLTAGASFRNSDAWKREFEIDGTPRSRVLRAGRFGVGVLAGFLLGPRMEVTTRHIRADYGIQFGTKMDLQPIELRYAPGARVGTEIRIQISEPIREQLVHQGSRVLAPDRFGWFVYDQPRVGRYIAKISSTLRGQQYTASESKIATATLRPLKQRYLTSPPKAWEASGFRQLRNEYGYSAYWTYQDLPALVVNGIYVTESRTRSRFSDKFAGRDWRGRVDGDMNFNFSFPAICIEDPDGVFPINVRRSDIIDDCYCFESRLFLDVIDDYFSYLIVNCPSDPILSDPTWGRRHRGIQPHARFQADKFEYALAMAFYTKNGATPLLPQFRQNIGPTAIDVVIGRHANGEAVGNTNTAKNVIASSYPAPAALAANSAQVAVGVHVTRVSISSGNWEQYVPQQYQKPIEAIQLAQAIKTSLPTNERNRWGLPKLLLGSEHLVGVRCICPTRLFEQLVRPGKWISKSISGYQSHQQEMRQIPISTKEIRAQLRGYVEQFPAERTVAGYTLLATPGCPSTRWESQLESLEGAEGTACFVEIFLADSAQHALAPPAGPIAKRWNEVFRQPLIPFDPEARRQQLAHAYKELEPFIRVHEAMKAAGVNY